MKCYACPNDAVLTCSHCGKSACNTHSGLYPQRYGSLFICSWSIAQLSQEAETARQQAQAVQATRAAIPMVSAAQVLEMNAQRQVEEAKAQTCVSCGRNFWNGSGIRPKKTCAYPSCEALLHADQDCGIKGNDGYRYCSTDHKNEHQNMVREQKRRDSERARNNDWGSWNI